METDRKAYFKAWNADKGRRHKASYKQRLRAEMLRAYGEKCACCDSTFGLTLDHINNDGHKHIRWGRREGGHNLYARLRAEGWPKENYQLLCASCNHNKTEGGICSHESFRILAGGVT